MCRLLGITNFDYRSHGEIIRNFFRLADTGNVLAGDAPGHRDGWGAGYYREGKAFLFRSGNDLLTEESRFFGLMEDIGTSKVLIVHLRKSAWTATSTVENAHPFLYRNCLFAHNGTVRNYEILLKNIPADCAPRAGALDTEVFFHFILGFGPDLENSLGRAVRSIQANATYSALNCLLTDGARLYAYRDYCKYPEYYSLYRATDGSSAFVSSEPLSHAIEWEMMEKGKLHVL